MGDEIKKISVSSYEEIKSFITKDLAEKKINFEDRNWGIIVVGSLNEEYRDNFIEPFDEMFRNHCYKPSTCKGLEFLYGYVIYKKEVCYSRKTKCKKFVAFSRFRDNFVEIEFVQ